VCVVKLLMGFVMLTALVALLAYAFQSRFSGSSIAFNGRNIDFNVWDYIIVDTIDVAFDEKCWNILLENFCMWLILYSFATLVLYVKPQKDLFRPLKLNKNFPSTELMTKEFSRSVVSVVIGSVWEMIIAYCVQHDKLPLVHYSALELVEGSTKNLSLTFIIAAGVGMYVWGDFHFYCVHRMLHIPFLYKNVHKIHHESFNPNPWSGLSFHPVEGVIYFSSAPIIALVVPYYLSRLVFKSLFVFPLEGHAGTKCCCPKYLKVCSCDHLPIDAYCRLRIVGC
jgi:sterol desaturase/sphingolipid hydroxylase (fatty acid hydroxylase superfamily)